MMMTASFVGFSVYVCLGRFVCRYSRGRFETVLSILVVVRMSVIFGSCGLWLELGEICVWDVPGSRSCQYGNSGFVMCLPVHICHGHAHIFSFIVGLGSQSGTVAF